MANFLAGGNQERYPIGRLLVTSLSLSTLLGSSLIVPCTAQTTAMLPGSSSSGRENSKEKEPTDKSPFASSGSGTLLAMASGGKELGQCPLKHTDVQTQISGYIARVKVKQTFANTFKDKIEAIYTFPLSDSAAVDSMVMKIGDRVIKGDIKKREEAKQIYEQAKAKGHVASLLDQERSNIFTQSVANIEPGKVVEITIEYIDLLPYEDGRYTFAFPTVVGPRFNPGRPTGHTGTGRAPDTTAVPDASKITPPITPEGTRAGHDISISVNIDAGVKLENISSKLHQVTINNDGTSRAKVELQNKSTIPNKDFVLTWDIAGDDLKSGYLTYRDPNSKNTSGYFTLMLVPPKRVTPDKVAPKEMIFLIDCSGSQFGPPLQKAKETLTYIIDHMNPQDTFQIISFSSGQELLFNKPRQSTPEMKSEAKRFIDGLQAQGGTWMAPAVEQACSIPADNNRLRIVTFMTDGYVGNDMEIVGLIRKHRERARWFPFGTGNSVNRFLIDGIAREGGGEPEYVLLNSPAGEAGQKFYKRIASPVLTDVRVKFDGLTTKEVFPKELADVWAQKPLYITGRYLNPGAGTVELTGFQQGKPYSQKLPVTFPESNTANEGIASVWARAKVDRLMSQDWSGAQQGQLNQELKDEIIATALEHHIMTQFTSFVAVEEKTVTKGGESQTVTVPVEMPDGVSREGVFGDSSDTGLSPHRRMRTGAAHGGMRSLGGFAPAPASSSSWYKSGARFNYAPNSPVLEGSAMGHGSGRLTSSPNVAAQSPIDGMVRGTLVGKMKKVDNDSTPEEPRAEQKESADRVDLLEDKSKPALPQEKNNKSHGKLAAELVNLPSEFKRLGGHVPGIKITNGKALVKVVLSDSKVSKKVLDALKKAGLVNISTAKTKGSATYVTGRIEISKLLELASLSCVKFISPE